MPKPSELGGGQDTGVDVAEAVPLEEICPGFGAVLPAQHGQLALSPSSHLPRIGCAPYTSGTGSVWLKAKIP
ncbi:hypothetical protein [Streptomyces sp. NPDC054887]